MAIVTVFVGLGAVAIGAIGAAYLLQMGWGGTGGMVGQSVQRLGRFWALSGDSAMLFAGLQLLRRRTEWLSMVPVLSGAQLVIFFALPAGLFLAGLSGGAELLSDFGTSLVVVGAPFGTTWHAVFVIISGVAALWVRAAHPEGSTPHAPTSNGDDHCTVSGHDSA
ncbi:MAG: hypothetical protein IPI67_02420 [Myxococcales bacterium]|nr:hypothetical protein [Myxococcales bacterium]